jgi:hypothetical protein
MRLLCFSNFTIIRINERTYGAAKGQASRAVPINLRSLPKIVLDFR